MIIYCKILDYKHYKWANYRGVGVEAVYSEMTK